MKIRKIRSFNEVVLDIGDHTFTLLDIDFLKALLPHLPKLVLVLFSQFAFYLCLFYWANTIFNVSNEIFFIGVGLGLWGYLHNLACKTIK